MGMSRARVNVSVSMSEEEYAAIRERAEKEGVGVSTLIRAELFGSPFLKKSALRKPKVAENILPDRVGEEKAKVLMRPLRPNVVTDTPEQIRDYIETLRGVSLEELDPEFHIDKLKVMKGRNPFEGELG